MRPTLRLICPVSTVVLVLAASAQPLPTIRTETHAVQVDLVATDSHGRPVTDLSKENFTLLDSGRPREIQFFAVDRTRPDSPPTAAAAASASALPGVRTVVILMDAINDYFDDHARALQQAIKRVEALEPGERIALYMLDQGIRILQPYTTDRTRLLAALRAYRPPPLKPRNAARGPVSGPRPAGDDVGNGEPAALRELLVRNRAIDTLEAFRAIANQLASLPGRKGLIWLSAGFPPDQLRDLDSRYRKVVAAMNEANVALCPVDARGLLAGGGDAPNIASMEQLAEATGGRAYSRRNDLDHAIGEAGEDVRATYTLGFYLAEEERDGKFHELRLRSKRSGIQLRYRKGYFAGIPRSAALEEELLNPLDVSGVGIRLRVEKLAGDRPELRLHLTLDPRTVTLAPEGEGWVGKLEQLFVETDDHGRILAKVSDSGGFRVTPETRPQFERTGAAYARDIPLEANASALRVVIRDTASGRTGSLSFPLPRPSAR